jgi:hypothetical protein
MAAQRLEFISKESDNQLLLRRLRLLKLIFSAFLAELYYAGSSQSGSIVAAPVARPRI